MTHTTVSATMGFALAAGGTSAVQWAPRRNTFPFFGGLAPIFMSWIITPGISGCLVVLMFIPLRALVLRSPKSFSRGLYVLPACVFLTFFVIVTFIIQTGSKNNQWKKYSDSASVGIGAGFAAGTAIIAGLIGWLYLGPRILAESADRKAHTAAMKAIAAESGDSKMGGESEAAARARAIVADIDAANGAGQQSAFGARLSTAWANFRATRVGDLLTNNVVSRTISYGANYKVHDHIAEEEHVAEVWQAAEVFDVDTERLFRYLQVFTACAMAFAHGSNDVANAMGPFAAVWTTWRTGKVPGSKSAVPMWILAMGGIGIVLGLATYGYKVLAVLAVRSVKLTNSRGFVVELATAMTVVLASRFGLPISTTQTVCGALLAIGLMEGAKGVNWRMAARILVGWIFTILTATGVAAGFTAWGLYTPNKIASLAAAAAKAVKV
jgi:sodium-dependent phosphate transporter